MPPRKPPALVFYFTYRITPDGAPITHEIVCPLDSSSTLVIAKTEHTGNYISIIVGPDDKREWFADEIISLKFGYQI